jgi:hypothetical protein
MAPFARSVGTDHLRSQYGVTVRAEQRVALWAPDSRSAAYTWCLALIPQI